MLKILLASLLFSSQVFAGLPPTTLKGQIPTAKPTNFFFEVPYNQATATAAVTGLIETGNKNFLANPSFENTTAGTSWTPGSGVTYTTDTTNLHDGKRATQVNITSTNGLITSQDVTPGPQLANANLEYSIWIRNPNTVSNLFVCARQGGATVGSCQSVPSSTLDWKLFTFNYPGPVSGSVGISLFSNIAVGGSLQIDEAYIGPARNIGTVQQSYVFGSAEQAGATNCQFSQATSTSESNYIDLGAAASCASAWTTTGAVTAVGATSHQITVPNLPPGEILVEMSAPFFTSGSGMTCNFQFSDSTNTFGYNTVFSSGVGAQSNGTMLGRFTNTTAGTKTFKVQSSDGGTTTCSLDNSVAGRKIVWRVLVFPSQSQQAVRLDNSDYDWRSYTPTFTGFGSVTGIECQERRLGPDNLIRCKFTPGTPTGVEARVSIPNTAADTAKIPSIQVAGTWGGSVGTPIGPVTLIEPSVSYVTFGYINASFGGLTKQNGNNMTAASSPISFTASVPIQGWTNNQNAPLLIGGVTSSSGGLEIMNRADIANNGTCSITSQSGSWISSVSRPGTGSCSLTLAAGTYSATPTCTVTNTLAASYVAAINSASTSAVRVDLFGSVSAAAADAPFSIICMGPR